jgi:hypothetical protein
MIRGHPTQQTQQDSDPTRFLYDFQHGDRDGVASGSIYAGAFPRKIRGLME